MSHFQPGDKVQWKVAPYTSPVNGSLVTQHSGTVRAYVDNDPSTVRVFINNAYGRNSGATVRIPEQRLQKVGP